MHRTANMRRCFLCGLTFELSGHRRIGAWPAKRMMTLAGSRAKWQSGGGPLERRVRPHLGFGALHLDLARLANYVDFALVSNYVTDKDFVVVDVLHLP